MKARKSLCPPNRRKEQKTKEDKTRTETPEEPEPTARTRPKAEPKAEVEIEVGTRVRLGAGKRVGTRATPQANVSETHAKAEPYPDIPNIKQTPRPRQKP